MAEEVVTSELETNLDEVIATLQNPEIEITEEDFRRLLNFLTETTPKTDPNAPEFQKIIELAIALTKRSNVLSRDEQKTEMLNLFWEFFSTVTLSPEQIIHMYESFVANTIYLSKELKSTLFDAFFQMHTDTPTKIELATLLTNKLNELENESNYEGFLDFTNKAWQDCDPETEEFSKLVELISVLIKNLHILSNPERKVEVLNKYFLPFLLNFHALLTIDQITLIHSDISAYSDCIEDIPNLSELICDKISQEDFNQLSDNQLYRFVNLIFHYKEENKIFDSDFLTFITVIADALVTRNISIQNINISTGTFYAIFNTLCNDELPVESAQETIPVALLLMRLLIKTNVISDKEELSSLVNDYFWLFFLSAAETEILSGTQLFLFLEYFSSAFQYCTKEIQEQLLTIISEEIAPLIKDGQDPVTLKHVISIFAYLANPSNLTYLQRDIIELLLEITFDIIAPLIKDAANQDIDVLYASISLLTNSSLASDFEALDEFKDRLLQTSFDCVAPIIKDASNQNSNILSNATKLFANLFRHENFARLVEEQTELCLFASKYISTLISNYTNQSPKTLQSAINIFSYLAKYQNYQYLNEEIISTLLEITFGPITSLLQDIKNQDSDVLANAISLLTTLVYNQNIQLTTDNISTILQIAFEPIVALIEKQNPKNLEAAICLLTTVLLKANDFKLDIDQKTTLVSTIIKGLNESMNSIAEKNLNFIIQILYNTYNQNTDLRDIIKTQINWSALVSIHPNPTPELKELYSETINSKFLSPKFIAQLQFRSAQTDQPDPNKQNHEQTI